MGASLKGGFTIAPVLSPIQRLPVNVIEAVTFFTFLRVLDWHSATFSIDASLLTSKNVHKTVVLLAK